MNIKKDDTAKLIEKIGVKLTVEERDLEGNLELLCFIHFTSVLPFNVGVF